MRQDHLFTARWHLSAGKPVPDGGPLESLYELMEPVIGPMASGFTPAAPLPVNPNPAIVPNGLASAPKWKFPAGGQFPAVIARFTPESFRAYVQHVRRSEKYSWTPTGITAHHTAVPNPFPPYDKWKDGWNEQLLINARSGYINERKFKAGPHVFTDHNGIWVFNPLSIRGTHATTFNSTRYGIEMLINGDDKKQVESEIGKANIRMGQIAIAILMKDAGISTGKLNFHRHDPETSKTCPGTFIEFERFETGVLEIFKSL